MDICGSTDVYPEHTCSLVRVPDYLSLLEIIPLPYAGMSAWTSLYGEVLYGRATLC